MNPPNPFQAPAPGAVDPQMHASMHEGSGVVQISLEGHAPVQLQGIWRKGCSGPRGRCVQQAAYPLADQAADLHNQVRQEKLWSTRSATDFEEARSAPPRAYTTKRLTDSPLQRGAT
jgi:hypothetical protein